MYSVSYVWLNERGLAMAPEGSRDSRTCLRIWKREGEAMEIHRDQNPLDRSVPRPLAPCYPPIPIGLAEKESEALLRLVNDKTNPASINLEYTYESGIRGKRPTCSSSIRKNWCEWAYAHCSNPSRTLP